MRARRRGRGRRRLRRHRRLGIGGQAAGAVSAQVVGAITRDGVVATRKVPSTPGNYADAVIRGIDELMAEQKLDKGQIAEVLHGCTVATNTIVEHKGAKTALITTRGFRDVLELRRIRVPRLYEPLYIKPQPLVPRALRLTVPERVDAHGQVRLRLDEAALAAHVAFLRDHQIEWRAFRPSSRSFIAVCVGGDSCCR